MCRILQTQIYKVSNASVGVGLRRTVIKTAAPAECLTRISFTDLHCPVPSILTDNCWDDAGPAPENHSYQLKVYTSQENTRLPFPQLTGYPGGQAGANPVVRKGKGSKPRKDAGKYFGGTKWEGSGQSGSKWWIKFLSSASWNKKIKQGKFGSQRWMVNKVKPARISTICWLMSSDRVRKPLS